MKHLKIYEAFYEEDMDYNIVYFYDINNYMAIGKIKLDNSNRYIFYDYYDNNSSNEYGTLLNKINYSHYYGDDFMTIHSKDYDYLNIASSEETEKYNLALNSEKFNL